MAITPLDLLDDGRLLVASAETEARRRSAVSRLYYAAYHHVQAHPRLADLIGELHDIRRTVQAEGKAAPGLHSLLVARLRHSGDRTLAYVGKHLADLLKRRVIADYMLGDTISPSVAEDTFDTASEIIEEVLPLRGP